jgi:hypothetical protein
MTSPSQFQTDIAFRTYIPVGSGTIYLGSDPDNSNISGSLVSIPYYKRGYISLSSGSGTQTVVVPGNSAVINFVIENRQGVGITNGSLNLTGRGLGGITQTLASISAISLAQNKASQFTFTSDAPNSGGNYCIPDVGQLYSTLTLTASGFVGVTNGFIYFLIGFIDTSYNTTVGQ